MAAQTNRPVLLVPNQLPLADALLSYLNQKRIANSTFTLFGGWGAISTKIEGVVRTGVTHPRLSLQYVQSGSLNGAFGMLNQVANIPAPATDYADLIAPSWYYLSDNADGSVSGGWDESPQDYSTFVNFVHGRNLKVLPMVSSSWLTTDPADTVLSAPAARAALENNLLQRVNAVNADGIVIDFEYMKDTTGPFLTAFMQELSAKFHAQGKLVIEAVMARTGKESWLNEFNYRDLAQAVDYLHIMTYDYSSSVPGPVAPLDWMNQVVQYAKTQGVDLNKVLLGIPYYGKDWYTATPDVPGSYTLLRNRPLRTLQKYYAGIDDLDGAMDRLALYKAVLQGEADFNPHYTYTDEDKNVHQVYFDDAASWNAKLSLMEQYPLAGVGNWSLLWLMNPATGSQIFPYLKQHLR